MAPQPQGEQQADSPALVELKAIDDEYLRIKRECYLEVQEVIRKHAEKQKPLLERRAQVLARQADPQPAQTDTQATGTPALCGFWRQALANHPAFAGQLEEWDAPVLEYLSDVKMEPRDAKDEHKGFHLEFHFVDNPFFENKVLSKEYISEEHSPYTGAIDVSEIRASSIEWKTGMDVTVAMVEKKKKKSGGGAKKAMKAKAATLEPRSSFFRMFFRNLKEGMPLPSDVAAEAGSDDEGENEGVIDMLMEQDHDMGCALRDSLIPFGVRWYTGEVMPEGFGDDDSDSDEDSEEEENDEDDGDSDAEEKAAVDGGADKPKADKKKGTEEKKKEEDCKQQ
mmetsp:Transcript_36441/g.100367  ORF Transcript_36441/g.100367 Transcript_36441/m.100367 type:complete len:338 (-) Transcript_36441:73-1086(-)